MLLSATRPDTQDPYPRSSAQPTLSRCPPQAGADGAGGALATVPGGQVEEGETSCTQEWEMGQIHPAPHLPLGRLAQDQKESSIPASDLSPMTPSPCETLPWQL